MIGANAMRARPGAAYFNDDQEAFGASGSMPAARPGAGAPQPPVVAPPAPWVQPANGLPGLPPTDGIGSHYQMHGRGPDGMFAGKKRNKSDKWREIAGVVGTALMGASGSPGFAPLMQMQMLRQRQRAEEAEAAREREAEFGQHDTLVQLLMRQGMSADQAELAALQPDKLGEEYVSRFRTREASPEETIYTPGFGGGSPQTWTAPKIFEDGPNRVQIDPNAGTATTLYQGKTDAEWAAEDAGIAPGTPAYNTFIRDYHLDGQGPTAVQMNRERLDQSNTNNVRTTSTSRDNSVRTTGTSRANNIRNNETSRDNMAVRDETTRRGQDLRTRLRGRRVAGVPVSPNEPMATDKDGNPLVIRNGAWVRAE